MKTYTIKRENGSLHAFEIGNTWISMNAIRKILSSVPGVMSLEKQFHSETRLEFIYNNEPWVVWEPWGDNSRYWIGPKNSENHSFDVQPINNAFVKYQLPLKRLWNFITNAKNS